MVKLESEKKLDKPNLKKINRQKPVQIERQLKSRNAEYKFKKNQPCSIRVSSLRRGLNSLDSASEVNTFLVDLMDLMQTLILVLFDILWWSYQAGIT